MGWICKLLSRLKEAESPEEVVKPDWVTQSRRKVAEEEIYAASIHYSVMVALEEGKVTPENWGSYEWNERWYRKHLEAAYYTSPEYCKEKGIV